MQAENYRSKAYENVQKLPHLKYQKRFERILKLTELVEDEEAKNDLFFEVQRTLRYFSDIKGFHQKAYLDKQTTLLHQGVSALVLNQGKAKCRKIGNPDHESYLLYLDKKQFGVFKKRTPAYLEIACWDLSHLFGCSQHIAPSFMLSFQGNQGSYQPFIRTKVSQGLFQHCKHLHRVDKETFWKANLFVLILGHLDLVTPNIPITKRGNVVFFDNECTFLNINHMQGSKSGLALPLVNAMIEWPHAKQGLTKKEAEKLNKLVDSWKNIDLDAYLNHPLTNGSLSPKRISALKERVQKILDFFPLSEGQTFEEFFLYFYPNYYRGVDEVLPLVERISNQPMTPHSALVFISTCRSWWKNLSANDNQKLLEWVEKYHGDRRK